MTAVYIAATLVLLLIIVQIALRPLRDLYGPIVWWSQYDETSVGEIVKDLEDGGIIPPGTTWQDANVSTRRASLRLVLSSPSDALAELARAADLTIKYKVGYHGDIIAAPEISAALLERGAAVPQIDRKLEQEILSRATAPN